MLFQMKGTIDEIEDKTKVSETFSKRNFTLLTQNTPERFEYLKFELHQDRCSYLDDKKKGDRVVVSFQIQGNKWTGENGIPKIFNTFKVYKLEKDEKLHPWGTPII